MAEEGLKKAFRLVLVGWANSGKSATGNTILGRDEFLPGRKSSKCVSQHAQVAGRDVTVMDTPGWTDYSVHDTPESTQREIISSGVPVPDAVLLLIPLNIEIREGYINSVTDHLSLLGDTVWSRTTVLFTFGNCLKNQTIESYIEGNSALQFLTRLCGNNYHVFENRKGTDCKQIEDLLIKIENMSSDKNLTDAPGEVKHFSNETKTENTVAQSSEVGCEEADPNQRSGGVQCFPELRMVLLGLERSGKSSTGNTILGSATFGEWTAKYQKAEAEVAGRRLVVIDTPPWQKAAGISPDENIVNWVCQCPPGPHALIFVLFLSSKFAPAQWRSVQRYMELLGQRAWKHAIVIFTGADIFEGMDMKSFLRSKESLQELLEKCGNRHYFFNNKIRGHSTQVTDLLEGIEKLSSQHNPGFYQMDKTIAASMEEMNQAVSKRAQKRSEKKVAKERAHHVTFCEKAHRLPEVRMVLLGERCSGKTFAAKTMANLYVKEEKKKCVATETTIDDRCLLIVDTPGWSIKTYGQLTPKQETITEALSLCHPGPHVIVIVVNLRNSFTEKQRVALEQNLACLANTMWKHAMVLFTFGESLQGEDIGKHIMKEGENLLWLVEKCGNRCHVFSNTPFDDLPQVRELLEKIDTMVEANSGQYFSNIALNETLSGEWRSDPMDMEDDDFEYTQREKKMMEKMIKKTRQLLMVDIMSYIPTQRKSASNPYGKPNLSQGQPTSEDGMRERQKGTHHQDGTSSGYSSAGLHVDD